MVLCDDEDLIGQFLHMVPDALLSERATRLRVKLHRMRADGAALRLTDAERALVRVALRSAAMVQDQHDARMPILRDLADA